MRFGTVFFSITLELFHHHASAVVVVAVAAAVAVVVAVVEQIYHEKDTLDNFFRHDHPCAKDWN